MAPSDERQSSSKRARTQPPQFRAARHRNAVSNLPASGSIDATSSSITTLRASGSRGVRLRTADRNHANDKTAPTADESVAEQPTLPSLPEAPAPGEVEEGSPSPAQVEQPQIKKKRKRVNTRISKLNEWLTLRDSTLDELLRHDGLGSQVQLSTCCVCEQTNVLGEFRCRDCGHGRALMCLQCMLLAHESLELHRIEKWNGRFFENTSLSALGLRIQLGHDGAKCPCLVAGPQAFLVFDTSGAHSVKIDFCGCSNVDKRTQLLRKRWFPATTNRPQTVATFELLDWLHESTLQGKGNLYDDYHTILRKTDSANLQPTIYRYPELQRIFRLWRNLMALKRAGRGHDPTGVDGTSQGALVPECPACPHPGRNLPDDWETSTSSFLYALFLAVDANFKLKGKDRKLCDVALTPGTSVFVDEPRYQSHIANYVDAPEMNTCESEHDAIVKANTRSTPGYAVSGCGVVMCSRHQLVRKNGAGDLQKGEKYCNMDFIILSALAGVILHRIILTYDIACQWSKNFGKRMAEFPEDMHLDPRTTIDAAIPGWHINGHGRACRENFCLAHMLGACRTCGDEIEGGWSHMNPLAASTREMGPAARHDALNDHWNGWNFRKIVGLRVLLLKAFVEAAVMKDKHAKTFSEFSSGFTEDQINRWTAMIVKWEVNRRARNPYAEPPSGVTLQDVRLKLAQEEAALKQAARDNEDEDRRISLTGFFMLAFDIEDRQFQLRYELAHRKKTETSKQKADFQEKCTALSRQIQSWRQAQLHYTPHAAIMISQAAIDESATKPETSPLYLPSSFPANVRSSTEMARICDIERQLRVAQADDALSEIRKQRRIIQGLWRFKKVNVSGTGNRAHTRMLSLYNRINQKVERAAQRYRIAFAALGVIDPNGAWKSRLRELRKEDISGPGKDPDPDMDVTGRIKKKKKVKAKDTKGRFEMSWIWLVGHAATSSETESEEEFDESMRAEWAKARARKMRWEEEWEMVQEEMRRVLAYFDWKARWWREQANIRKDRDADVLNGVRAYALKQEDILVQMASRFATDWIPVLEKHGIKPEWLERFRPYCKPGGEKSRAETTEAGEEEEIEGEDDEEIRSNFDDDEIDDDFDFAD